MEIIYQIVLYILLLIFIGVTASTIVGNQQLILKNIEELKKDINNLKRIDNENK